jgi:hypothetical protein
MRLLRLHEREDYPPCLAKKAVASFKMSRSSRNCWTSRRRWTSSARSSLVSGGSDGGRVALSYYRNVGAAMPRSRAIFSIESELVRDKRIASALNSELYVGRRRRPMGHSSRIVRLFWVSTKTDQLQRKKIRLLFIVFLIRGQFDPH